METNYDNTDKLYTYNDFLSDKKNADYELINGRFYKFQRHPSREHHDVKGNLYYTLKKHLHNTHYAVHHKSHSVRLPIPPEKTADNEIINVLRPDIFIMKDCEPDENLCYLGSPVFIAEILSRGTSKKDVEYKFKLYEKAGVGELWLIHPFEETLIVFRRGRNDNGKYEFSGLYSNDSTLQLCCCQDFSLELNYIFED